MSVVLNIISDFDTRGIKKAEKAFASIENAGSKVGASLKKAFLPVGIALGGLAVAGANFAMAAAEDAQSAALLARQLKVSTKATDAQVKSTESFILAMSLANGVADDELRPNLAKLSRGTKDLGKAQKLLALSMDIAKGSGKSLSQVTDSISRAMGGNMGALARLSPEVKQMVKENRSLDDILKTLGKTYEGSAATAADTFKGRMDRLKVAINETKESIGYVLLPIFERMVKFIQEKILPAIQRFVDSVGEKGLAKTLKASASDLGNWLKEADGATGAAIDFSGAILLLVGAFKGLAIMSGIASTLTAVSGALAGLAGIAPALGAAGFGLIAGAIGLIVINIAALFALLRDDTDRNYLVGAFQNFAALIGNAFIGMYNVAAKAVNGLARLGNIITPGDMFGTVAEMDYLKMDRNTTSAPSINERNYKTYGIPSITVNTGVGDKVAIGKEVADVLNAYNRRTGNTLARP
jgi:hypothetical protein